MEWKNKQILVTGSEGLIGKELTKQLRILGARVNRADFKLGHDLRNRRQCDACLEGIEYVFHLAGVKGNPKKTKERPVDFMGPMLQFDTNMIIKSQEKGVKGFLYTSSIAVENPETDFYPAWAKSTAEKLIEAMRIQYPEGTKYCIVRPANVYGRFDDFNNPDAMVVTKLINIALKEKKIILDNKGSQQERDFINAKDVARGMIEAMEKIDELNKYPLNLCSGKGVSVETLAKLISIGTGCELEYKDLDIVLGPDKKVMKLNWDFKPQIDLPEGILEVINWNKK